MSEIDDIFATKWKGKATKPSLTTGSPSTLAAKPIKKKTKKKRKTSALEVSIDEPKEKQKDLASSSKKRPLPETVVDTSQMLLGPSKRHKGESSHDQEKISKSSKGDRKTSDYFKDSRGTTSRRTTEEGWSIFKEDELGIGDEGGDTPLCPFDCDCCF